MLIASVCLCFYHSLFGFSGALQTEFTKMMAGFFGGEGFVLQRLTGKGDAFVKARYSSTITVMATGRSRGCTSDGLVSLCKVMVGVACKNERVLLSNTSVATARLHSPSEEAPLLMSHLVTEGFSDTRRLRPNWSRQQSSAAREQSI